MILFTRGDGMGMYGLELLLEAIIKSYYRNWQSCYFTGMAIFAVLGYFISKENNDNLLFGISATFTLYAAAALVLCLSLLIVKLIRRRGFLWLKYMTITDSIILVLAFVSAMIFQ
jgi:hypothetical protein